MTTRAIRQADVENSALAEHAWTNHHPVDWNGTQACFSGLDLTARLVEEALTIKHTEHSLNQDSGTLDPEYDLLY